MASILDHTYCLGMSAKLPLYYPVGFNEFAISSYKTARCLTLSFNFSINPLVYSTSSLLALRAAISASILISAFRPSWALRPSSLKNDKKSLCTASYFLYFPYRRSSQVLSSCYASCYLNKRRSSSNFCVLAYISAFTAASCVRMPSQRS